MFPLYFFMKTLDFFNIIVYNGCVYILVWRIVYARAGISLPKNGIGNEKRKEIHTCLTFTKNTASRWNRNP